MTVPREVWFWGAIAAGVVAFAVVFQDILLPFVAGWFIAYLFSPAVRWLLRLGLGRTLAVTLITLGFVAAIVVGVLLILPALVNQLVVFLENLPAYIQRLQLFVQEGERDQRVAQFLGMDMGELQTAAQNLVGQLASWALGMVDTIWTGGRTLISVLALLLVTPVIAFYLLLDWDRMCRIIDDSLPREHAPTIRRLLGEMDEAVGGFIHGQFVLGIILGAFYATALLIVGLDKALLIGIFAGLISFVPYLGSTSGFVISVGVALGQFWPDWIMVAIVAGIFLFGQFVEGNVLQPRLVGGRTGLHPVWLIFALFAFGTLFGFAGLLMGVPAAAAIGVLVRFAFERYRASHFYAVPADAPADPAGAPPPDPAAPAKADDPVDVDRPAAEIRSGRRAPR